MNKFSDPITDTEQEARAAFAQGNYIEAEELFRQLAAALPQDAVAHYNWGVVLAKLEHFEQALVCYRTAITLNPAFAPAYTNFGFCLNALGLIAQARQAFALARSLAPDDPIPVLNEGIAALALGDYAVGWQDFAARWQLPAYAKFKRDFDKSLWCGENLEGKTLFLYAEQGFGDSIQMARYLSLLAAQNTKVIVEVPPALTELMQTIDGITIITKGDAVPAFDYYCALMDVPAACGTLVDTIPAHIPYLKAEADKIAFYERQLPRKNINRVGLAWAGRPSHENDHNRSMAFKQLAPLLQRLDIEWVSLQRHIPERDKADMHASAVLDWGQTFPDFAATAAAIMALDLVIAVDSAVAHLAGALGKPVWVLLPFYADWRWLTVREDSPWYPTARLFRQKKRGDWSEVIIDMTAQLSFLASS